MAMSVIAFGGAAQFAAIGWVATGLAWPAIALLTFLLNARHALYSAALAPWFRGRSFAERVAAAHLLTDESFALAVAHFKRLGRFDAIGYWYPAIVTTLIPWNVATFAGVTLGDAIVEPNRFGIDVIFPAAMGGLMVGLLTGRREVVAALAGAAIGVVASLAISPTIGDHRRRGPRSVHRAARPADAGLRRPAGRADRARARPRPRRPVPPRAGGS